MKPRAPFLRALTGCFVCLGLMSDAQAVLVTYYDFEGANNTERRADKAVDGLHADNLSPIGLNTYDIDPGSDIKPESRVVNLTEDNNGLFSNSTADTTMAGSFSIALWIKYNVVIESQQDFNAVINKRNDAATSTQPQRGSSNYWMGQGEIGDGGVNNAFRVSFDYNDGADGTNIPGWIQYSQDEYDETLWHHYAMVFDTDLNTLKFYLDGDLIATSTDVTQEPLTDENAPFSIGRRGTGTNDFNGWVDEVRLYNHPLTDEEVAAIFAPTPPDLEGDYNGDGFVNLADYTVWRDTLGATGPGLAADGDGSETVDEADYALWKQHFGESAPGALATLEAINVPEPTSVGVLAAALGASALRRFRRRRG